MGLSPGTKVINDVDAHTYNRQNPPHVSRTRLNNSPCTTGSPTHATPVNAIQASLYFDRFQHVMSYSRT